ncbi:alpha/beta hydrolase [Streptomyces sp. NBC_00233]|uniref:alpha/beta hydrolase n=1 Tax=Streptomyces sp. NBC_00233 TaxID=2975686 RepID=UPI0022555FD9|nr:alpha/beta hydrolase [Streptomyces sp. NBC_00233]MCX5233205.1 alpha/beta hydrolase [Streptomyces sp. NBC_00233]
MKWTECGDGTQCADAKVPLDYDHPDGTKINISLIRRLATDPSHRIGSIFVNNGGPGNSVLDFVRGGDSQSVLPEKVQKQFDVIGFDPRGVGRSTPVRCFIDNEAQQAFFADRPGFPLTTAEIAKFTAGSAEIGRRCQERNGELLKHLSTANVARDMDLLRRAVGDDQLTYAGYSYGGLLGLTYANLFPNRVRALMLDGLPDPREYTRDGGLANFLPASVRVDGAAATSRALGAFFDACDQGGKRCSFGAPDVRAKFDELMKRLKQKPVVVETPDGPFTATYAFVIDEIRSGLQFPPAWPFMADQLQATWDATESAVASSRSARTPGSQTKRKDTPTEPATNGATGQAPTRIADSYDNHREALLAVFCSETGNPRTPQIWPLIATLADQHAKYFGADWAYVAQPCATWPAKDADRFTGEYTAKTANPLLFVNGTSDAASNYEQAVKTVAVVPGARLLTVNGPGHPASFIPNSCLSDAAERYLVSLRLPEKGTVCTPDLAPFGE